MCRRRPEGDLSDDLMPSGRKRGFAKYFRFSGNSVDASRLDRLARIAFSKDSQRPLEQLFQTTGIETRFANTMVYDTSDARIISGGSTLLGELDGQMTILGHLSAGTGDGEDAQPMNVDTSTMELDLRQCNRSTSGAVLARRPGTLSS